MSTDIRPRTLVGSPQPDPACVTCGRHPERIEWHHVAGWRNDPDLVVPLCPSCHKVITMWQYASGVELETVEGGERHPVDIARAVLIGCLLLVELFLRRHPSLDTVDAQDARLVARWVSREWDRAAEIAQPERAGRWSPDARRERPLDISRSPSDHHEVATLQEWRRLLDQLQSALGLAQQATVDGVLLLDLDRPRGSAVVALATAADDPSRARGFGIADTVAVLAELHASVKTTTDRALKRDAEGSQLREAEASLVLAVVASAMRLILATLR